MGQVHMDRDRKQLMRRRSMQGTALFALGILAAILAVVLGSAWLAGFAALCLIPAVLILHRVGQSLP